MSVGYFLVNTSKQERLTWPHLSFSSKLEIMHNPVARLLVTSYLLDNAGDSILFIPDLIELGWPANLDYETFWNFSEVTDKQLAKLEKQGFVTGRKKRIIDEDDPEIYVWDFDQELVP